MDPKDDYEKIDQMLRLGQKPMPSFEMTLSSAGDILARFGEGGAGFFDPEVCLRIYENVVLSSTVAGLDDAEKTYLPKIVFLGIDRDYPPLYTDKPIFDSFCSELSSLKSAVRKNALKTFLNSDLAVEKENSICRYFWQKILRTEFGEELSGYGLDGVHSAENMVRKLQGYEFVYEAVPRRTGRWISPYSPFARTVWLGRMKRYKERMRSEVGKTDLSNILADLRKESVSNSGKLRWQDRECVHKLAHVILDPFARDSNILPNSEQERNITDFWISIFGDPNDSANNHKWYGLPEEFLKLLKHWSVGRQLNEVFIFVDRFSRGTKADGRWSERKRYWMAYWNAGRIKASRVYIKRTAYDRRDWAGLGIKYGELTGNLRNDQAVMLFELDENLIAAEVNYSGSLRINFKKNDRKALSVERYRIDYNLDVQPLDYNGIRHVHGGNWRSEADDRIRKLSGKSTPFGTL